MKNYQAYLFDWDGTLAQTLDIWLEASHKACRAQGVNVSDREIASCFGDWELFTSLGVADLAQLKQAVKDAVVQTLPNAAAYEGVAELLEHLKQNNRRMAVISASDRAFLDSSQAFLALSHYFDVVISGDMVTAHKPDPQGVYLALQKLGVSKEQAVMLGDSDKDLGAAKNAGIDTILFYPDRHKLFHDQEYLLTFSPVKVVRSWHELIEANEA